MKSPSMKYYNLSNNQFLGHSITEGVQLLSSSVINQTQVSNNLLIAEQINQSKQDRNLFSENLRERLMKTTCKERFDKDRKFYQISINKVREDISHYYDKLKPRTSDRIAKVRPSRSKHMQHTKQKSQINLPLIDMEEYNKLQGELRLTLSGSQKDLPAGRVESIKLQDWFNEQKPKDHMAAISVAIQELIKQVKVDCLERGLLLESIWNEIIHAVHQIRFDADVKGQKTEISAVGEYNRVHGIYRDKVTNLENQISTLTKQLAEERLSHAGTKKEFKDVEDQFKKNRQQLNEIRKITQFLKKKLDNAHYEIEILNRKLGAADSKHLRTIESSKKIQKKNSIQQPKSDSDSEPELLDGLLDDKNIVEMDNMVINMDKVIKVACFASQIDDEFRAYIHRDSETQTQLNLMDDKFALTQDQLHQIIEFHKTKVSVESTIGLFTEKSKLQSAQLLNQIIDQKFMKGKPMLFRKDSTTRPSILRQPTIDSDELKESPRESPPQGPLMSKFIDYEKIKTLIVLLNDSENRNREYEETIALMQSQCDHHLEQLRDAQKRTSMMSMLPMIKQREEDTNTLSEFLETAAVNRADESMNSQGQRKKTFKQTQQQSKFFFKGPQLGQKVNIVYDFQKTNAGPSIVEKVKTKQIPKIKNFMPQKLLLKQISVIYQDRIAQQKENQQIRDQDMASYVYSYFLNQFGIKKIAEQKFLILVLSVKHNKSVIRINVFARFLGLFDQYTNYQIDEMKKYLEAYDFVTNICQLGQPMAEGDSEQRFMVQHLRAIAYIGYFADSRMSTEEKDELKRELELLKEMDQRGGLRQAIIDFDTFMIQMFVKYKILVSRAKEYVINAFAACDLDGNGMCNFEEWYLLLRHIEPDRLTPDQISEIFFTNADLIVEGEQNFSFEKFAVICVEYGLFQEEAQNAFIQSKGTKTELMSAFQKLVDGWQASRENIEKTFENITLLDTEKQDHWHEIIDTLQTKIMELKQHIFQPGIEKKVKPLLIANILLQKESQMLLELQREYEEDPQKQYEGLSSKLIDQK